jgi:tetratricopeptide (TPR) repeat protein
MNPNYTNTELLTKYLEGELDDAASKKLELRINEDNSLKEELDNLKISLEVIKSFGLHEKVGSVHAEMMKELKDTPMHKSGVANRFIRNALRVAATVIILLGVASVYEYLTLSSNSLFKNNFQEYTLHENRGNNNETMIDQEYKLSHFSKATELFSAEQSKTLHDYFIAGNAYLQLNNPADAIKCFLSVQQINELQHTHIYQDDTQYYLAMSYLENKEPAKAIPLFEKIHADGNHLYHSKVTWWFLKRLQLLRYKS